MSIGRHPRASGQMKVSPKIALLLLLSGNKHCNGRYDDRHEDTAAERLM